MYLPYGVGLQSVSYELRPMIEVERPVDPDDEAHNGDADDEHGPEPENDEEHLVQKIHRQRTLNGVHVCSHATTRILKSHTAVRGNR